MENRLKFCSRSEIAYLLGLSPSQVSRLRRQGLPVNDDGKTFDARAVHLWDGERAEVASSGGESEETLEVLARWREWKCKREALSYQREAGELLPVSEVRAYIRERIGALRQNLENLSARLSGQLVGQTDRTEVSHIIEKEVAALELTIFRGGPYDDGTAAQALAEIGNKGPRQAASERSRENFGKPIDWSKYR